MKEKVDLKESEAVAPVLVNDGWQGLEMSHGFAYPASR